MPEQNSEFTEAQKDLVDTFVHCVNHLHSSEDMEKAMQDVISEFNARLAALESRVENCDACKPKQTPLSTVDYDVRGA